MFMSKHVLSQMIVNSISILLLREEENRDRIDFLVSPPMEILLFDSFFIRFSNAQCFVSPDVAPGFNSLR